MLLWVNDCLVVSPVVLADVVVPALVLSSIVAVVGEVVVLLWVNDSCPMVGSAVVLADVVFPVPIVSLVVDAAD